MDRTINKSRSASSTEGRPSNKAADRYDRDSAAFRKALEKKAERKSGKVKDSAAYLKKEKKEGFSQQSFRRRYSYFCWPYI